MRPRRISFCLLFALLMVNVACGQQKGITDNNRVNAGASIPSPADQAIVETDIPSYKLESSELDYIQSLPAPIFRLNFGSEDFSDVELPPEAITLLQQQWKEALKFYYQDEFDKPKTAQEGVDRDKTWFRYCNSTNVKLQAVKVHAPLGSRNLSYTESETLWATVNKVAVDIIRQAKEMSR